jgi:DNA-binding transcriptional MerR regulator
MVAIRNSLGIEKCYYPIMGSSSIRCQPEGRRRRVRISELARRGGVPVATVKYYLREGLLHEGVLTSPTQARYDDSHLARLRLIRALLGPGGLSVSRARDVLAAIAAPPPDTYDLLGVAAAAIGDSRPGTDGEHPQVHELLRRWGWPVDDKDCPSHAALARALAALDDAEFVPPEGMLDVYADHVGAIAEAELAGTPTGSASAAVRYVVLGTVLMEPVLLAIRRLAQQAAAEQRFAGEPSPRSGSGG